MISCETGREGGGDSRLSAYFRKIIVLLFLYIFQYSQSLTKPPVYLLFSCVGDVHLFHLLDLYVLVQNSTHKSEYSLESLDMPSGKFNWTWYVSHEKWENTSEKRELRVKFKALFRQHITVGAKRTRVSILRSTHISKICTKLDFQAISNNSCGLDCFLFDYSYECVVYIDLVFSPG